VVEVASCQEFRSHDEPENACLSFQVSNTKSNITNHLSLSSPFHPHLLSQNLRTMLRRVPLQSTPSHTLSTCCFGNQRLVEHFRLSTNSTDSDPGFSSISRVNGVIAREMPVSWPNLTSLSRTCNL
jgi:hypothetical protein